MNRIFQILEHINSINSVKEKQSVLDMNKNDEELKKYLKYTLDPYQQYQFNVLPKIETKENGEESNNYIDFLLLLNKLKNREITGNEARDEVVRVFSKFNEQETKWYSKCLLKKPVGVRAATVNKVWPELVPEFKLMLAPNKIPNLTEIQYPVLVQPKLDGYRCLYVAGKLWSRAGKPFGNKNLTKYFDKLGGVGNYVLDGELYATNTNFSSLQTVLNSHDKKLPSDLKFFVYDCVPLEAWHKQDYNKSYEARISDMRSILNDRVANYQRIIDTPTDEVDSPQEVIKIYKEYLTKGYEGVMLKSPGGKYQWKRTSIRSGEMLKLKPFKTEDLKIKDIFEGEGDFEGTAGGIVVDRNGQEIRVGSGFDFKTRDRLFKNPSNYIDSTAEIKFFEETEEGSLRHPVFMRFREDKD